MRIPRAKANDEKRMQKARESSPFRPPSAAFVFLAALWLSAVALQAAPHPSRGLWVGEVTLTNVNEVSVAVNAQNVVVAPDPNVPTPTADAAHLRLILHVDGDGQVRLLRSVAVINQSTNDTPNPALVTDESLYPNSRGIARRISAVAFDFGEFKAYLALSNVAQVVASA